METLKVIHRYAGIHGLDRSCGVEVFPSRDGVPIVVISQLPDIEGSVEILLDCIAAEVLDGHLPARVGQKLPFHCVEHYPQEEGSALRETFDLVTFADYEPLKHWVRGVLRLSLGRAYRAPFERKQLEAMIGGPYVWSFGPVAPRPRKASALTKKEKRPRGRRRQVRRTTTRGSIR